MMTTSAGGSGNGLSTILTGVSTPRAPQRSATARLIDRALTEMASQGPLRVHGYLDDPAGAADLILRSPDLGSLHPTESYQLFSALRTVDARSPGRHDLDIGSHRAMAVVVETGGHVGLWFFGDDRLDDTSVERLAQTAEAYGPAVGDHRRGDSEPDPVGVELVASEACWSATVRWFAAGDSIEGTATGPRPIDAAVAAVIDAFCADAAPVEVELIRADDAHVVLAVLRQGFVLGVGSAELDGSDDGAQAVAAAAAARRAIRRLTSS